MIACSTGAFGQRPVRSRIGHVPGCESPVGYGLACPAQGPRVQCGAETTEGRRRPGEQRDPVRGDRRYLGVRADPPVAAPRRVAAIVRYRERDRPGRRGSRRRGSGDAVPATRFRAMPWRRDRCRRGRPRRRGSGTSEATWRLCRAARRRPQPRHRQTTLRRPLTPEESRQRMLTARRRLLGMLLALEAAAIALAMLGLAALWVVIPPSVMLAGYMLLLREAAHADTDARTATGAGGGTGEGPRPGTGARPCRAACQRPRRPAPRLPRPPRAASAAAYEEAGPGRDFAPGLAGKYTTSNAGRDRHLRTDRRALPPRGRRLTIRPLTCRWSFYPASPDAAGGVARRVPLSTVQSWSLPEPPRSRASLQRRPGASPKPTSSDYFENNF